MTKRSQTLHTIPAFAVKEFGFRWLPSVFLFVPFVSEDLSRGYKFPAIKYIIYWFHQRTPILPESARTIWKKVLESYHLKVLPVTPEISFVATELPEIHKNPADRLIIATAKVGHLAIVPSDHRFPQYGVEVVP